MSETRPVTSRARGVCRYYSASTGCFAGRNCKFLHGAEERLTPYDKGKTCRFFAAGFCKRGAECWFIHSRQDNAPSDRTQPREEFAVEDVGEDEICCICYEKPTTYGLMGGCSHIFCLGCIKEWRDPHGKSEDVVYSGVTKKCPLCRAPSQFVTPSSHFYPENHPSKATVVEKYRESTSRVPCRYFERSPSHKRYCPFGKDCFYRHMNSDGTPYVFKEGVERLIRSGQYRRLRREIESGTNTLIPELDGVIAGLRSLIQDAATHAAGEASTADIIHTEDQEYELWPANGADGSGPILGRLAQYVLASLGALTLEHTQQPNTSTDETTFQSTVSQDIPEVSAVVSPIQHAEEVVVPSTNPISDTTAGPSGHGLLYRSHESISVGDFAPPPLTVRPASAPSSAAARFSTTLPGRASFTLRDDIGAETPVPWTRSMSPTVPVDFVDPMLPTPADESTRAEPAIVSASDPEPAVSPPPPPPPPPPPSESTNPGPLSEDTHWCDMRTAALVQDTDPPFMTDGRGRVVWSSTTATPRSRRGRTTALSSSGATASLARDKPRGEVQAREASRANSPVIRPVSLGRRESDT